MMSATTVVVYALKNNDWNAQALSYLLSRLSSAVSSIGLVGGDEAASILGKLENLVPREKLEIVEAIARDFESIGKESYTISALLKTLTQATETIITGVHRIRDQVDLYKKSWFFQRWYWPLDVSDRLGEVRKAVDVVNTSFDLLTHLLPSCCIVSAHSMGRGSAQSINK